MVQFASPLGCCNAPICSRHCSRIKDELEDAAFEILHPEEFTALWAVWELLCFFFSFFRRSVETYANSSAALKAEKTRRIRRIVEDEWNAVEGEALVNSAVRELQEETDVEWCGMWQIEYEKKPKRLWIWDFSEEALENRQRLKDLSALRVKASKLLRCLWQKTVDKKLIRCWLRFWRNTQHFVNSFAIFYDPLNILQWLYCLLFRFMACVEPPHVLAALFCHHAMLMPEN